MCFGALMNITMIYSMTLKQLDPLNHTDIYCLHFVFLLRIQKHLRAFQESWNHHALSTENTNLKSPYQTLFLLDPSNCAPPQTSLPTTPTVLLHTYISLCYSACCNPPSKFVPCRPLVSTLSQHINTLEEQDDFGCGLYLNTIQIVKQHLSQNCVMCGVLD